jgi:hypothetical protein
MTTKKRRTLTAALEAMAERHGLDPLLARLEVIALNQSWQAAKHHDEEAASAFRRVAALLEEAATRLAPVQQQQPRPTPGPLG